MRNKRFVAALATAALLLTLPVSAGAMPEPADDSVELTNEPEIGTADSGEAVDPVESGETVDPEEEDEQYPASPETPLAESEAPVADATPQPENLTPSTEDSQLLEIGEPDDAAPAEPLEGSGLETSRQTLGGSELSAAIKPGSALSPFKAGVTRLAGDDRYKTAAKISQKYRPGVEAVYVATGVVFPDALAASAVAASQGAPILLTNGKALSTETLSELKRLKPVRIFAVGGTSAVSRGVFDALKRIAPTQRISGSDRYTTGVNLVKQGFDKADTAFVVTGRNFPDALAATGAAGKVGAPLILVDGNSTRVGATQMKLLSALKVKNIKIIGGTSSVSGPIFHQLSAAGYKVDRIAGDDRYESAARINNAFFKGAVKTAFVADGSNFPDALAGAAVAGHMQVPLYVSKPNCLPNSTYSSLKGKFPTSTVILGGPNAVRDGATNRNCENPNAKPPRKPGPSSTWLTDLNAVSSSNSYRGSYRIGNKVYAHSLAMGQYSYTSHVENVAYDLRKAYDRLDFTLGFSADGTASSPRAIVEIVGDGKRLAMFDFSEYTYSAKKSVSVVGITRLQILTTRADDSGKDFAVVLGNARLMRNLSPKPKAVNARPQQYLSEIPRASGNMHDYNDRADMNGNVYVNSILGTTSSGNSSAYTDSAVFVLGGQYRRLVATLGNDDWSDLAGKGTNFAIYGDGRLLYNKHLGIGKTDDIDLDMTGVTRLTIQCSTFANDSRRTQPRFGNIRVLK